MLIFDFGRRCRSVYFCKPGSFYPSGRQRPGRGNINIQTHIHLPLGKGLQHIRKRSRTRRSSIKIKKAAGNPPLFPLCSSKQHNAFQFLFVFHPLSSIFGNCLPFSMQAEAYSYGVIDPVHHFGIETAHPFLKPSFIKCPYLLQQNDGVF